MAGGAGTRHHAGVQRFRSGEVASGVGRRVRNGEFSVQAAMDAVLALDALIAEYETCAISPGDVELARSFVIQFDLALRLPDAIHIAIASRNGSTLVSLDKR